MKSLATAVIAWAVLATGGAQAQLVTYTFDGSFSPSDVNPNLEASGFGDQGSDAQVGLGNVDGKSYGYVLLKKKSSGSNSSQQNKQYGQFTIERVSGFSGQITSVTLKATAAGKFDGNGLALRWSGDNYASDLGNVSVSYGPANFRSYAINFRTPLTFGGTVTFRLYAYSSRNGQSLRFQDLVINGDIVDFPPDTGPPTVTVFGNSLQKTTRLTNYTLGGTATDENTVRVVEYSDSKSGPWRAAEGTTRWTITSRLKVGVNKFFIRATDFAGSTSDPIKVTVRRKKVNPAVTPTPTP